jgi:hypothetical protein
MKSFLSNGFFLLSSITYKLIMTINARSARKRGQERPEIGHV